MVVRYQNDNGHLGVQDGELSFTFQTIQMRRAKPPTIGWVTVLIKDVNRWGRLYGLTDEEIKELQEKKQA